VADRVEKFALVAAAGSSGSFQNHTFLDGIVTRLELYVPPGHAGLTAWQFYFGTAQLLPNTTDATIVADDQAFEWDLEGLPTGAGGGGSSGYRSKYSNSDTFPHTFHIQVWLDELGGAEQTDETGLPVLIIPLAV
jgi:hypothetical protein